MKLSMGVAMLGIVTLLGCGSSTEPAQTSPGIIKVLLVDRPADYDAVNIVVTEVSIHSSAADSASGWTVLNDDTRAFDLLTLRNGASQILGEALLNPGRYTQIRLKLAESCTVIVDGLTHPLEVPSGIQSGLKLNHPFEIAPDTLYELTLDFDAKRSIHVTGNGRYKLSPVIRVVANRVAGTVSGTVDPAGAGSTVFTLVGADTVSTFANTLTGAFRLMALPANTYVVQIVPMLSAYRDTTLTAVHVTARQDTDLGTITLGLR